MTKDEALDLALDALKHLQPTALNSFYTIGARDKAIAAIKQARSAPVQEPMKLWLWKNFVNGRPEYWAFNNPFPCLSVGGDPLTFGEPCGWALLKPSVNGRPDRSIQEVTNTVTRLATTPPAAQRQWVGLMRGVRVEGDTVVITVKGGNDAARELCSTLIQEKTK